VEDVGGMGDSVRETSAQQCRDVSGADIDRIVSNCVLWGREYKRREVFLPSSLCGGDRRLYCTFDLDGLFCEPVPPLFCPYFSIVVVTNGD